MPGGIYDLEGKKISKTYQRVVQYEHTGGVFYDGRGDNIIPIFPKVISKTSNYTATYNDLILCNGTFTITMPNITTNDLGKNVWIINEGNGIITGDGSGSDTLYGESDIEIIPDASMHFTPKSTTKWILI